MSAMAARKLERVYTYKDYLTWDDDIRCELIDGVVYNMAAPSIRHQDAVGEVFTQLKSYLKGKKCKPYVSPVDVRLNADKPFKRDDTVVQPDVIVLCDPSKIDNRERSINGAPDLVVEVLSQSTVYKDRALKFKKYQEAGVREYWIVDIDGRVVEVYAFEENPLIRTIYSADEPVPVRILDGCEINLTDVLPPLESDGDE